MTAITAIAFTLMVFPSVFAEESQTWSVIIPNGASEMNEKEIFYPYELPVNEGDTVQWINQDTVSHSITSGLPKFPDYYGHFFEAGLVEPGKKISAQIKIVDGYESFYYVCSIHPWMTGKIFVAGTVTSMPETLNPIQVDKASYQTNDEVLVTGQVHQDFWGTDYELLVYDQKNNLIDRLNGDFDEESKFTQTVTTNSFENSGKYKLKLVYALPSKAAEIEFDFSSIVTDSQNTIPTWIKDVGGYWCTEQINDTEFINAIQYLVQKEIISVKSEYMSGSSDQLIPEWIKNNTCWWSDDKITDIDFLSGIEFLVNKGTIRI